MKARFIKEFLNFERTGNPIEKMGIGQQNSLYNILKKANRNLEEHKNFRFNIFTEISYFEVKIQGLIDNQMSGYNDMFNEMGIRGTILLNKDRSISINAKTAYFVGKMKGGWENPRRDRKNATKSREEEIKETFDNADDFIEWLNELAS